MSSKNSNIILPEISVIIPTFNRENQILRAVYSVLNQTFKNLECIVVNDCSTDNTLMLLSKIKELDGRLIVINHESNKHASASRNTGIQNARGNYIAFLDDDDEWLDSKLEKQYLFLQNNTNVAMVYCWLDIFKNNQLIDSLKPTLSGYIFDECLPKQPIGNASTLLLRVGVIKKIGNFDTNLPRGNDGDFIRRVAEFYEIGVVKEVLVKYFADRDGNPRISLNDKKGIKKSIHSQEIKLNKFRDQLKSKKKEHQLILISISRGYFSILLFRKALIFFFKSIHLNPFNVYAYLVPIFSFNDFIKRKLKY
jgi:glycosyltransferase involved in cell wall biosynthesis